MFRKLFLIFLLAAALAALLIWKPWRALDEEPPRIYDRLPEADVIGISNILELSGSLSKTMFYYKIPMRDVVSPGFILSQGKQYGLDVQSPVFFFINEKDRLPDDWGILMSVRDSSKVREGIIHLQKFMRVTPLDIHKTTIYQAPDYGAYMVYGSDWMLLYKGDHLEKVLNRVMLARHNEISPRWREFVNKYYKSDIRLVASLQSDEFEEFGIASAGVSLSNDSTGLIFTTYITQKDSLAFQARPYGPSYGQQEYTRYAVNLHFDVERLKRATQDPLYKVLKNYSGRVGFPLEQFLDTWEGNIAFRQGGLETIKEKYIESELDENFNITEVTKTRNVKISGFSLYLSTNQNCSRFLAQLSNKGILTESDSRYRLLFSPPLHMHRSDTSLVFHTSTYAPKMYADSSNSILWSYNYTPIEFVVDSTSTRTLYGKVRLPLRKIISDNIPEE